MASGAPGAIRTHDRLLRRQMLYPTELRAQPDIPSGIYYARLHPKGKLIRNRVVGYIQILKFFTHERSRWC